MIVLPLPAGITRQVVPTRHGRCRCCAGSPPTHDQLDLLQPGWCDSSTLRGLESLPLYLES